MHVVIDTDLATFAGHVMPRLLADPVRNNVPCTLIDSRRGGLQPIEPDALWIRVLDGQALAGVALQTPPFALLLTDMPTAAVDALADHLAAAGASLPGVAGPSDPAGRFAGRWAARDGVTAIESGASRMFRLDRVDPPSGVPGVLREATGADRDQLVKWSAAFHAEAVPHHPHPDPAQAIDWRLALGGLLWVWETDGGVASTLWLNTPAAGVVRVSGVFTPPALRGHGYASACVAGASQVALDRGAVACMLYTDLANPTSNKIYHAIGYRPVADAQEWRFG